MRVGYPALALLGLCVISRAVGAQEVKQQGVPLDPPLYSVQGGLLQSSLSTNDEDFWGSLDSGIGFYALGTVQKDRGSVSVGVQRSSHGVEDFDENLAVTALFLEPRFRFALSGMPNVTPYVGGRAGWTMVSGDFDGDKLSTSGLMVGLGTGLSIRMTPVAALDFGVHWNSTGYSDVKIAGDKIDGTDGRASQVALRAGITYNFASTH